MRLRTSTVYSKALAMFVALMLLLGTAIVSLTQFIIAREFERAEEREAEQKLRGLDMLLKRELDALSSALGESDGFPAACPEHGAPDILAIAGKDGTILETHPGGNQHTAAAWQLLAPLLSPRVSLEGGSGFAAAGGRLFGIAWQARPGDRILLAGKDLSRTAADIFGPVLGGTAGFVPMTHVTVGPPGTEDLLRMLSSDAVTFVRAPPDHLTARRMLFSPDRSLLGVLEFTQTIPPERSGQSAVRVFLTVLVLAGGVFFGLVWYLLDRTILQRIRDLTRQVEEENRRGRLPVRLAFGGGDELGLLARRIEELAGLLEKLQQEYRAVVEDQTELICRFDESLTITFANSAFEKFFTAGAGARGKKLHEILPPAGLEFLQRRYSRLFPGEPIENFQHPIALPPGGTTWFRSTLRRNFSPEGVPVGGQWVAADVSREVEAEREIAESERRLRQLSARLLASQEEERRRIARELHDSTAQSLAALEMNVSLLEPLATDARSRRLVSETRSIARDCCQELRNISYLLHPPLLEEVGLPFAIQWFADGFAARSGIAMTVDIAPDFPRLAPDVEAALFRVVQEATSNIYRHSGASSASLVLRMENADRVLLTVSDNGKGFPAGDNRPPGIGLAGMRERLAPLGGELFIENSPRGVTLTVSIPARTPNAEHPAQAHPDR